MINALHLIWIIPLSASAGAFCMALAVAAGRSSGKDTGLSPEEVKTLIKAKE